MRRSLSMSIVLCASVALAQPPNSTYPSPRLNSIFPCGGKTEASFEVTVRGSDLDDASALRFSHKGMTAELITAKEPPKKDAKKGPSGTDAKFKVTIGKAVPTGTHEVRVVGRWGVSNPRSFVVGTRSEINEAEPNSDVPVAQKVEFDTVVNGVIEAQTDIDYFKFDGKAGRRVLIHCAASSIDSRARPFIECYSSDGRSRIGLNRNYSGNDALCDVTLPSDGEYFIRISEFAYTAGGSDYFYRLSVGAGPWLDAVYPPMIEPGKTAMVMLVGRELKGTTDGTIDGKPMTIDATSMTAPAREQSPASLANYWQSFGVIDGFIAMPRGLNAQPVFFASAPVILESSDDNNTPEKRAQRATSPSEISGVIYTRHDRDNFKFAAKKGEPMMVELFAERIGTTLDAVMTIRGPDGKEIAGESMLDDDPETLHPTSFFMRTTDPPPYRLIPSSDGDYTVTVWARDSNANFGPRTIYRLRIAPPKPSFRAVVMARNRDLPSGVTVMPAGETALDVFAQRLDGFTGPITISVSGLPDGVTAKPAIIGTGQKWGMIILHGAADLKSAETDATVTATATIDGKEVKHNARSASITWNVPNANNSPTIARLDRGLVIAARPGEKAPYRLAAKLENAIIKGLDNKERPAGEKLVVKPGEKIIVPISVNWQGEGSRPNVINLSTEPTLSTQGQSAVSANNNQPIPIPKDKAEQTVTIDVRNTIAPGLYSVMLRGDTRTPMISDPVSKAKKEYIVLGFVEPFTVKVLPLSLGRLSAQATPIKIGGSGTLTVRVERAFDFNGVFPVTVKFPEGSGLSAEPATIPAGANEVKITINASKDAKASNVQNVNIESIAVFDGDDVTHKTQANITIGK